jgi:hypothetical protein
MASLADLINLDLSDTTDKIIVEYLWLASSSAFHLLLILTEKKKDPTKDYGSHSHAKLHYLHSTYTIFDSAASLILNVFLSSLICVINYHL